MRSEGNFGDVKGHTKNVVEIYWKKKIKEYRNWFCHTSSFRALAVHYVFFIFEPTFVLH